MTDVVIVGALRTPIGSFMGSLSRLPAHALGAQVIKAVLDQTQVNPGEITETIMGQVLTAGEGQNPARQAAMLAGIPKEKTAFLVNQVCGSGLRAVALAYQSIALGDSDIVIAGGQESMSQAPHCTYLRQGIKMGNATLVDTMIKDGLWEAFNDYHMGMTVEHLAEKWGITREQQDEFAAKSQAKAAAAQKEGRFKAEIAPVVIEDKKGPVTVDTDEYLRPDTNIETLAKLRAAFKSDGTVTAGNSSGINDGAAAVLLMRTEEALRRGLEPFGRIVSWATTGVDPNLMGTGPISASQLALEKAGWSVKDLDLVEANEAFAAQACVVNKEMGWDLAKVNVNGGAIALGHPIGASGTRVLVSLLHEMKRRDAKRGLATLCIGGGMGIAMCVERNI